MSEYETPDGYDWRAESGWPKGKPLKFPAPYFGAKARAAALVWARLGNTPNYLEPFAATAAVLLRRPWAPARYETINDYYCHLPNVFRALKADPWAVVEAADWIVAEADLTARHRWLQSMEAPDFRKETFKKRMLSDPDFFDAKIAGWWLWGASCWIGAGWCDEAGVWYGEGDERNKGRGMHSGDGTPEMEVSSETRGTRGKGSGCPPIHQTSGVCARGVGTRPDLASESKGVCLSGKVTADGGDRRIESPLPCVHKGTVKEGRPHLQRPYQLHAPGEKLPSIGHGSKGMHATQVGANLLPWFLALQARLRYVRVCCGDWERICGRSVLEAASPCALFFDPPYSREAGRDPGIYQVEDLDVAHRVRKWCLEHGDNSKLRIALSGYCGEGHEELETRGWSVVAWKASGGYSRIHGEDKSKGLSNRHKERIWFSPWCEKLPSEHPLFPDFDFGTK